MCFIIQAKAAAKLTKCINIALLSKTEKKKINRILKLKTMSFPTINDSDKMLWHPGLIFWMLCFWHTTRCRVSDVAAPVVKVVGVQRRLIGSAIHGHREQRDV